MLEERMVKVCVCVCLPKLLPFGELLPPWISESETMESVWIRETERREVEINHKHRGGTKSSSHECKLSKPWQNHPAKASSIANIYWKGACQNNRAKTTTAIRSILFWKAVRAQTRKPVWQQDMCETNAPSGNDPARAASKEIIWETNKQKSTHTWQNHLATCTTGK